MSPEWCVWIDPVTSFILDSVVGNSQIHLTFLSSLFSIKEPAGRSAAW